MAKRKKRVQKRKVGKSAAAKSAAFNRKAQWKAYKQLQMRADKAWEKFRSDVKKNARSDILINDHRHLLLLLGECNYMARECMRMSGKGKRRR
jgi:hypothetical protein